MTTLSFHKKGFLVLSKIYIHVSVFIGQSSSFLIYYISFEINSISELRIEPTVQRYNRNHKTKCEFWIENDRWNSNIRIERSFGRMDIRRATVCGKCVKCPFIRKTYTRVVHICNSLNSAHIFSVIVNIHAIHDIYIYIYNSCCRISFSPFHDTFHTMKKVYIHHMVYLVFAIPPF